MYALSSLDVTWLKHMRKMLDCKCGTFLDGHTQFWESQLESYCVLLWLYVRLTVGKLPGAALFWFGRAPSKSKKGSNEAKKNRSPFYQLTPLSSSETSRDLASVLMLVKSALPLLNMMPTDPSVLPLLCDRQFSSRAQKNRPWSWLSSSSANNSRNCPVRCLHNCGVIQLESAPRLVQK